MTARQFFLYLRQIFKLSSAKQLQMFEASLLPHMKESDRRSVIEGYRQVVIPVKVDEQEIEKAWNLLRKGRGRYGR